MCGVLCVHVWCICVRVCGVFVCACVVYLCVYVWCICVCMCGVFVCACVVYCVHVWCICVGVSVLSGGLGMRVGVVCVLLQLYISRASFTTAMYRPVYTPAPHTHTQWNK